MKIKFTLDSLEIRDAIAAYVTQLTGMKCNADNVQSGTYSWDAPYVVIDTDVEQEIASIAAEQERKRIADIKEAA